MSTKNISKDVPAWELRAAQVAKEVTKKLSKRSPKIKQSKQREWLSTAQYAERMGITVSAAKNRLARAFSAKYYDLPKLSGDNLLANESDLFYNKKLAGNDLIIRCVPNSKGNKKYEVLLSSLPDYEPCESKVEESANDTDGFHNEIPSFLEEAKSKIFCDWVTMSQRHPDLVDRKNIIGGFFLVVEDNGELLHAYRQGDGQDKTDFLLVSPKEDIRKQARMYFGCEGSWDSRVFIRLLDGRVDLHGNIGRYNRPDNVFGYSLEDCIKIANNLLAKYDLPPFTGGSFIEPYFNADDKLVSGWDGATFSRIDLTINLSFGHPDDAKEYLNWLATQHISRMRNHVHPDGNTVEIGCNDSDSGKSKYIQMVAYNKAIEFQKHSTKHLKKLTKKFQKGKIDLDLGYANDYYEKLQNYMNELGVARLELRLKRDYLQQHSDIKYLGALQKDFTQLNQIFIERWKTATREFEMKDINQMSLKEREVYGQYLAGVDMSKAYGSKATFYRKRKLLLPYGVDISQPYKGETTAPKLQGMRMLKVRALPMPEWYYLPPVESDKAA
jgi:hypothetical protein